MILETLKHQVPEDRYYKSTEKELDEFCDNYFNNDSEFEKYCNEMHIPFVEDIP